MVKTTLSLFAANLTGEKSEADWHVVWSGVLLFLFPIAAVSIRHWVSVIFLLQCLIALHFYSKTYKTTVFTHQEKFILGAFFTYFIMYIVSVIIHGWYDAIGVEIKYLLVIPLYILFRSSANSDSLLVKGSIISCYVTFVQTIIDTYVFIPEMHRAGGIYGPLFLGPIAVLTCFVGVSALNNLSTTLWRYLAILSIPLTIYSVVYSESRGAYIALIVVSIFGANVFFRSPKYKLLVILSVCLIVSGLFYFSSKFQESTLRVAKNISNIADSKNEHMKSLVNHDYDGGIDRYILWVTALRIIKDHPLMGIGYGKFQAIEQLYVDKTSLGSVNYRIEHGHSHNIFLESYLTKGIAGFLAILAIIGGYLYVFVKNRALDKVIYVSGVGVILIVICFGMFESAPINKHNFSAFFVVYSLVFLAKLNRLLEHKY
ncbi:MAG: O-antigen ligase family protein [Gammaproteobacteria bacterium]|nr:O-antigen ligase family protein [Gammaproteobacteria bacterium]